MASRPRNSNPLTRARAAGRRVTRRSPGPFDLAAIAARGASDAGMPARGWPADDVDFVGQVLRAQHAPEALIERLAAAAAGPVPRLLDRLAAALGAVLRFMPLDDALRHQALLLLGPPGAGKTTLAAKLAARLGERHVLVVSTDTARAGGVAQLEEYMNVLGLPVAAAEDADALRRTMTGAAGRTVIVDTAGIALDDPDSAALLQDLIGASGAEPVLVLPADTAADEAVILAEGAASLGVRLLLVTRLDLVRRIGGVLAGADSGKLAFIGTSVTPHFAYGLRAFTPEVLARRLLLGALHEERWQPGTLR
jgi:flagellar biosynthesis protein FlhF